MGLLHDPSKVEYILVPRLGSHPQLTMYLKNYDGVNQFSEQGFQANFNYSCVTYDFPNITLIKDSVVDLYSPLLQLTVKGVQAVYGGISKYSDIATGASLQHMNSMLNTQKDYASNIDKLSNIATGQLPQANINIDKLERLQRREGRLDAWDQFKQDVSENGVQRIREAGKQIADTAAKLDGPAQISSGTNGGQWVSGYIFQIGLYRYEISQLRLIKQYVERYGLSCYSIINKWAPERQRFDYVECQDIVIKGDIPQEAKAYISQMFTEGVMFWHDNDLFNYSNNGDA